MFGDEFTRLIRSNFSFLPTQGQENALLVIVDFLLSADPRPACILRGYAGTGKTALLAALVRSLEALKRNTILLAPTGRAAKVFAKQAARPAFTIHRRIYRQKTYDPFARNFVRDRNPFKRALFIIDECSMLSATHGGFDDESLLADLIEYVYSGEDCRLLLCGDTAQLPPVGEENTLTLSRAVLERFGLSVWEYELDDVVRQQSESGILWNATRLRRTIQQQPYTSLPKVRFSGFSDILPLQGKDLVEALSDAYAAGLNETVVITRSNKRANTYNKGIRTQIFNFEGELIPGDRLIIAKNNYFWTGDSDGANFLANGDAAVVRRAKNFRQLYGFHFADVEFSLADYEDREIEAVVLLDTLHSNAPALEKEQADKLFHAIEEDYAHITNRRERMSRLKQNPYLNALQVKYAYALTCHKAQGGQWKNVFVDQGFISEEIPAPAYFRWLYTAFTRSSDKLFLINWPKNQIED